MVSLSSVIYAIEGIIPFPVPGGKWGFSNFLVLYLSYYERLRPAVVLAISKSLLGSILTGTFLTAGFFMGFAGATVAAVTQWCTRKLPFLSLTGVSLVGMVSNNIVQFLVGSLLIGSSALFIWLPVVMLFGTVSAIANAFLADRANKLILSLKNDNR